MKKKYFVKTLSIIIMIIICISNFDLVVFASNSQSFQLDEGWNLITVSVIPSNSDVAQVIPCADIVKNDECYFSTNQPAFLNSISDVIPGHGYLVHVNEICNFDVDGELINPSNVVLKEGWNIVGYPFLQEQDIESALSSIINNIEVVKRF
jgi:hypothetical protein